jgi:hypothetical protein
MRSSCWIFTKKTEVLTSTLIRRERTIKTRSLMTESDHLEIHDSSRFFRRLVIRDSYESLETWHFFFISCTIIFVMSWLRLTFKAILDSLSSRSSWRLRKSNLNRMNENLKNSRISHSELFISILILLISESLILRKFSY